MERAQIEKPEPEDASDKIVEGMKAIKEYCQAHPLCEGCRFASNADDCELREKLPNRWETDK